MCYTDKKGTEWQFAIIPLGGFVKFSGDDNLASIKTQVGAKSDLSNPLQFNDAPLLSRFLTVLAGPLANFIFSVLIFSLILLLQGVSVNDPVIGKINKFYESNYDIRENDKILKVENKIVDSFSEIFSFINKSDAESLKLTIKRDNSIREIEIPYLLQPIVEAIEPLSAASLAGLQIGDVFLTVDDKKLNNFNDLREKITQSKGRSLKISVFRDGQILQKTIQPVLSPIEKQNGDYDSIYRIGVAGGPIFYPPKETPNVFRALIFGTEATAGVITASFNGIKGIIKGQIDPKHLSGPIGIAHAVSDSINSGIFALLSLIAIISSGIGFVNLLPIPILDGGHIIMMLYEYFSRKKPSEGVLRFSMIFGLVLLLSLLLFTTFNDISRLVMFLKF